MAKAAKLILSKGLTSMKAAIMVEMNDERAALHSLLGLKLIEGDKFEYRFGEAIGEITIPRELMDSEWVAEWDTHLEKYSNTYLFYKRAHLIAKLTMIVRGEQIE